ncbi:MAG: ABC transporter ATP-binding protein [Actinobacteria bacterium]|nr:ABC transporter ATP-binding protein [Actinomycetota bacterium]
MIQTNEVTLSFGEKVLFEDVSVKFLEGNCYGLIGANGSGKSSFLKLLSGDLEPTKGSITGHTQKRLAVLKQDQYAYDEYSLIETVMMGYPKLYEIYAERNRLYSLDEMSDADGERAGELECEYADLDGYNIEADAATMLSELGLSDAEQQKKMAEMDDSQKVKVLLAQALFSDPDILLLDEPTNQLDYITVLWLENFLLNFKNTVIVISHDRHFLNKVCTHIADLDFNELKIYTGNYDFWKNMSELMMQQKKDQHKTSTDKIKELEEFVRRFSANASKSKQATSRKKLIEKLRPEELPTSSRKSPYIHFNIQRPCGDKVLTLKNISHKIDGEQVLSNVSFTVQKNEKIAIIGKTSLPKTTLLDIISGKIQPDEGSIEWGSTIQHDYFPKDNSPYFNDGNSLFDWLNHYSDNNDIQYIRGLLGRLLFSGHDVDKKVSVLSGGEKARAMFSKLMISEANFLLFDDPTNHLDLESISALNDGLINFKGTLLVTSHDFELLNTVVSRVIEVSPKGFLDRYNNFNDYIEDESLKPKRAALYQ